MITAELLTRMIKAGAGEVPADVVIKNVRLLDVISGAVMHTDIAIVADRIVGTYGYYNGKRLIEGENRYAVPGFIDTHLHIESSLVTPLEFDRCVLPHGVTTVICDPHEIANVLGAEGIRYFLESAERAIMDIRVNLSSCVPATAHETSGARLEIADLEKFRHHKQVIGLAEMMNFPGVLAGDKGIIDKLVAFQGGHIDGHAPLLTDLPLNGYLAAGIRTDHEATTATEAREKLRQGHGDPDPRGLGIEGPRRAGRSAGRQLVLVLCRAVHRRPQSARHSPRKAISTGIHPHADPARPAAAPRLPRRLAGRRRAPSA
jgi:adenine deaminase